MLSTIPTTNLENDSAVVKLLYDLSKRNEFEQIREILSKIDNKTLINKPHRTTGSTCLHVACYYGNTATVRILLNHGALHSIRNIRHNLTPFEETQDDTLKQLLLETSRQSNTDDHDFIEWILVGDNLLDKKREFHRIIDLYKSYDNQYLISKLLVEVIHYYLNEYLINQINENGQHSSASDIAEQINRIQQYFSDAIKQQDYLTYFVKAYTLSTFFFQHLNRHLAIYILDYFDDEKHFAPNYRLINCLGNIVALLIHHPNLSRYEYKGICYRGMIITANDLIQYERGKHVLNRTILSASLCRVVAEMFAGESQQQYMRYHHSTRRRLQYSCLCKYSIRQNKTAINIETLSESPDEKEILILPFNVFKVVSITDNSSDPNAKISIEIDFEECVDDEGETIQPKPKKDRSIYPIFGTSVVISLLILFSIFTVNSISRKNISTSTKLSMKLNDSYQEHFLLDGCPIILNRSDWNARPPVAFDRLPISPVPSIVLRQMTSENVITQNDCVKILQKEQNRDMNDLGWFDIGYNFIICTDQNHTSKIFTGRGWNHIGAHCKGYNARSLGIGVIGNVIDLNSMDTFKLFIRCAIQNNFVRNNFTLVSDVESKVLYQYYLNYLKYDQDIKFGNQNLLEKYYCQ